MSLQSQIHTLPPAGEPGQLASTEASQLKNAIPSCRAATAVKCGGFAFAASAPTSAVDAGLQEQWVGSAGSAVVGFIYRVQDASLPCNASATLAYGSGQPVPVAESGAFYCPIVNGGTVGQKVLADVTDGTASAGDSATSAAIDTGFVLKTAVSSGGIAIIQK